MWFDDEPDYSSVFDLDPLDDIDGDTDDEAWLYEGEVNHKEPDRLFFLRLI